MGGTSSKRPKPPSQPLDLYAWKLSPPSRAVLLYILQNGLLVEFHPIDVMKGETKTEEFTKMNPHQSVPVLKDRELVVVESQAIIRYLAHRYTNFAGLGTTGKNPNWAETSKVDATVCWLQTTFYRDVFDNYVLHCLSSPLPEDAKKHVIEQGKINTKKHLDTIEKVYLEGNDFLGSSQQTVADLFGGVFLSVLELTAFDLSPWPKVSAWFQRMKKLDHWAEVHQEHREFAKQFSGVEPEYPEPPKPEEPPAAEAKEDAKPSEEKPPAEEKPSEKQPAAEEKPAEKQETEEKPAEEKPEEEKPAEEQPAEEQPAEEQPAEEKPAEEQPAGDKQEDAAATEDT